MPICATLPAGVDNQRWKPGTCSVMTPPRVVADGPQQEGRFCGAVGGGQQEDAPFAAGGQQADASAVGAEQPHPAPVAGRFSTTLILLIFMRPLSGTPQD